MIKRKYSRQRDAIVKFLSMRKDHPTADEIYKYIRKEYPNISLGTVYRNLTVLCESGEIIKLSCGTGPEHYDGDTSSHYHFVCTECNAVSDLKLSMFPDPAAFADPDFCGHITGYSLYFYGKCPACNRQI